MRKGVCSWYSADEVPYPFWLSKYAKMALYFYQQNLDSYIKKSVISSHDFFFSELKFRFLRNKSNRFLSQNCFPFEIQNFLSILNIHTNWFLQTISVWPKRQFFFFHRWFFGHFGLPRQSIPRLNILSVMFKNKILSYHWDHYP